MKVETIGNEPSLPLSLDRSGTLFTLKSQPLNKSIIVFKLSSRQFGFGGYDDDPNYEYSHTYLTTSYDFFSIVGTASIIGLLGVVLYLYWESKSSSLLQDPLTNFQDQYASISLAQGKSCYKQNMCNWSQVISSLNRTWLNKKYS